MLRAVSAPDHPHDHDHDHGHALGHAQGPERSPTELARLRLVLFLTAGFMVVEAVGGYLARSLALVADAGHMLADVGALGMSLIALQLSRRPANWAKTYGYVRLEILAALGNGAVLLGMAGAIAWQAWSRLRAPVEVDGPLLVTIAAGGLVVNLIAARLLHAHAHGSLNTRGAYLHVLGDLLGSVGALAAGAIVWATGWQAADPIVSVAIALLIVVGAWRLVREAADVLLEAAPAHVDVERVHADLRDVPGLHDIHDLHVWTLTSGFVALSGHGVIDDPYHQRAVLDEVRHRLRRHGIEHVTFQLEPRDLVQMRRRRDG
jgi:cobalt-zinc-cadmium efflux system protein